jgi:hypothetical protein
LGGGPPGFPQDFTCPAVLGNSTERSRTSFAYRTITFYGVTFQTLRLDVRFLTPRLAMRGSQVEPRNPGGTTRARLNVPTGLGCFPFARRYSGNRFFFLFLGLLRWFSSPRWLQPAYFIQPAVTGHDPSWVSPFGNPRIEACLQLPEAYRSLPRPSSPSGAKASPMRS